MKIYGHEVIGHEVVHTNGCFRTERFWIRGWVTSVPCWPQFVWGLTGKETVITKSSISACATFEVLDPKGND